MAGTGGSGNSWLSGLTAEEKQARISAKEARRKAKLEAQGPEAVAEAEKRAARIRERKEAKKARLKAKKASKRQLDEGSAGAKSPKKAKKAAKQAAKMAAKSTETAAGGAETQPPKADVAPTSNRPSSSLTSEISGGEQAPQAPKVSKKAQKRSRLEAQQARERENVIKVRQQRLAQSASISLRAPYEVYLKYLPGDATEDQVRNFFQGCGDIAPPGPKLMRHHQTGRVIRGFVTFETVDGIRQAPARDLERMGNRSVSVTVATTTGTLQAEGTHTPAMFQECIRHMGVTRFPNGVFVDGTFGRGGHTRKILEALGPGGELHAFDMDGDAIAVGKQLEAEDSRFHIHHAPFSDMANVLKKLPGRARGAFVNGVLIDIGISSPQLDGNRGFRPEFDGPLDMRFDVRPAVESAIQYVKRVDRHELAAAIEAYGGEHPLVARRIADAIALAKHNGVLPERTGEFAKLVSAAKGREYQAMHPAKMTFQALRIVVNREYDELRAGLSAGVDILSSGGKIAILTWKHSECAIVVDFSRKNEIASPDTPLRQWYEQQMRSSSSKGGAKVDFVPKQVGVVVEEARRPTAEEVRKNSRSRSAVLHILRRETGLRIGELEKVARPALQWDDYEDQVPSLFSPTLRAMYPGKAQAEQ